MTKRNEVWAEIILWSVGVCVLLAGFSMGAWVVRRLPGLFR